MGAWLTSIFHGRYPQETIGVRNARELKTLAQSLDALRRGDLPALGDTLMQRFKAVQISITDGNWGTAARYELIPPDEISLASPEERQAAARSSLLAIKLDEAKKRGGKAG